MMVVLMRMKSRRMGRMVMMMMMPFGGSLQCFLAVNITKIIKIFLFTTYF